MPECYARWGKQCGQQRAEADRCNRKLRKMLLMTATSGSIPLGRCVPSSGHVISRCKIGRLNERRAAWSPGCRGCANGGALNDFRIRASESTNYIAFFSDQPKF